MKPYIADYNGILTDLKAKFTGNLATPADADMWVLWQDIRGSYKDLIQTAKKLDICPPVITVQHGMAATRDYGEPNCMQMNTDHFLCWGQSDYERLKKLGYKDRIHVVGCPLNRYILPRVGHKEKAVLFVPVNTGKEEPENIAVYYELMKYKYNKAQKVVLNNRLALKDKWGFNGKLNVSFNELAYEFDVVTKLLSWHDKNLYHGNTILGYQQLRSNNEIVFNLLRNVDAVIGLDEGTTEIFAYAHDVPVIVVDEFKYRQHKEDGKSYSSTDIYRTNAATHVSLGDLTEAIDFTLAHPEHKREERKIVAELEMGVSYGDATNNIYDFIKQHKN